MKILISGATGLIGTELVQLLLANNHSVNYLTTSSQKIVNQEHYNGFFWNPTEGKIDENCLLNVEIIIHLAGATIAKRWTNEYKQELIESRVLSANLLFNTLKKIHTKLLILYPPQVLRFIQTIAIKFIPKILQILKIVF